MATIFFMATISPDFKWLGFRISDAIPNLDHLIDHLKSVLVATILSKTILESQQKRPFFEWSGP